jgi:hypothetical protein
MPCHASQTVAASLCLFIVLVRLNSLQRNVITAIYSERRYKLNLGVRERRERAFKVAAGMLSESPWLDALLLLSSFYLFLVARPNSTLP